MAQLARVRKCNDDGTAQVIHMGQSACSGACFQCSGCGAARQTPMLTARNPIGAKPGQVVIIKSETGPALAAAILYRLPLVLFYLGCLLGTAWQQGALTGCLAFGLGIVLSVVYHRRVAKKQKNVYTIIGYGRMSVSKEKGDNDLD